MKKPPLRAAERQQWLDRIDAALRQGGMRAAGALALQGVDEGVEDPAVLNLAASARFGEGRFDEAAQLLKRARALAPRDPHILNSLGVCLNALGQTGAALQAYESALRAEPHLAQAHFNRGSILEATSDINGARAAYEGACKIDSSYVEPLAGLAWLDAQAGDMAAAQSRAQHALRLSPANVLARMALASGALQQGEQEDAATRLSELGRDPSLSPLNRSIVLGLIGDLQDSRRNFADAFTAYDASNAQLRTIYAPTFEAPGKESAKAKVTHLANWFDGADRNAWQRAPTARARAADPKAHIFLVGFPRSGTTLLENVLAAHPEVVSLEEKDCLESAASDYLSSDQGLQRLSGIQPGEAMRARDAYWAGVRKFGVEPRGRVFIDKLPLNSVLLPIVAKLFPDARILFAQRDPRDVVLSCFRRRFGMNPSMYELLTLEGAAAFYDAVMRLSELYRDILPLQQHVVRYESLIEDFEGTARAACAFLGLDWDAGMADFAAKARSRGISTPSAAQVARGLNRDGQGAWRRYEPQMAAVLPLLEPWVERFGYASA